VARTQPPKPSVPLGPATGTFRVSVAEAGILLDRFVRLSLDGLPWTKVRALIGGGHVRVNGVVERQATFPLESGVEVQVGGKGARKAEGPIQPVDGRGNANEISLLHADSQLLIVNKPSGISTEPYDENEKDTVVTRLARKLKSKVYVVHRLDKETTGVLAFARTIQARDHLKNQFRFHTTSRFYIALVHGVPRPGTIRSRIVRDRGDGLRGSTSNPTLGRDSTTHVEVLETFGEVSLIRCRLETGRTHQIRIHLAEAGHPLLGERVYGRSYPGERAVAPRVMLHAQHLGLEHPLSGERLNFEHPAPADFLARVEDLRARFPASSTAISARESAPVGTREVQTRPKRSTFQNQERHSSRGPRR
jgi:23S rRNA pseudouridine1911/1915/1917 synthase